MRKSKNSVTCRVTKWIASVFNYKLCLLAVILISLSTASVASAQSATGVSGHVADPQHANVQGARVVLRSQSGIELVRYTDSDGHYSFADVVAGDFIIEVSAKGFSNSVSDVFHVDRGQKINHDLTLSLASVSENVIVVANGTPQNSDQTAKSVSVVDGAQIEARKEYSLSEVLRSTPGLRVQQQGSPGALTTLRFRGDRNTDTSVLLDGLRIRDSSDINGSAAPLFSDLLSSNLQQVEILRGSGSSIYGTDAIGGVVNLVPRVGSGPTRFELGFEGGSLGMFRGRFGVLGGFHDKGGYSLNVTRVDYRKGVDGDDQYGNTTATGRVQFNVTPSITISGNFWGSFANFRVNDSPFALPAAFTSGSMFPAAIEGQTFEHDVNNPDEGRRTNMILGSVRLTQVVNDRISYSVAYQHITTDRRNYNGPEIDPRFASLYPFGDFAFNDTNNGANDTFDARANVRLGRYNLVTGGFEFERESLFQEAIPSFNPVNDTTDRQRTYAVFGQDQISLLEGKLQFSAAVREQMYRISSADKPGFLNAINTESSVVGDGAVSYFFASTGTRIRAHVGNGFRAPSLFERFGEGVFGAAGFVRFGDPTIRAEQSISVDAGLDQRFANDKVKFGVTYFYTRLQRTIQFESFAMDPLGLGRFSGYANEPGGISRGIEASAEFSPLRGTQITSSYTYTNSDRFVSGQGVLPEYVVPKNLFTFTILKQIRAFTISGVVNYTGSYIAPVFENNFPFRMANLTFSGFTKADAFVNYERHISDRLTMTLFGGADNLLNERYFENGFLAPGITARGGIGFKF